MDASHAATRVAEMIVQNGRQRGARRPLTDAVTIIGSAQGCDVRLNVDTVRPIHCLLAIGPDGPHLRSWGADDTFVNGEPSSTCLLCDGDIVQVGPFKFAIGYTAPLAEAAEPEPAAPVPASTDDKIRLLEDLYRQLSEARVEFRRDTENHQTTVAQQMHDLAEAPTKWNGVRATSLGSAHASSICESDSSSAGSGIGRRSECARVWNSIAQRPQPVHEADLSKLHDDQERLQARGRRKPPN